MSKSYVKLLIKIDDYKKRKDVKQINKDAQMHYGHLSKVINELVKKGILSQKRNGTKKMVKTTSKGSEIIDHLKEILRIMEADKNAN